MKVEQLSLPSSLPKKVSNGHGYHTPMGLEGAQRVCEN